MALYPGYLLGGLAGAVLRDEQAYLLLAIKRRMPELSVLQLQCKPTTCGTSIWAPPHDHRGTLGKGEQNKQPDAHGACCAMHNKTLCL